MSNYDIADDADLFKHIEEYVQEDESSAGFVKVPILGTFA